MHGGWLAALLALGGACQALCLAWVGGRSSRGESLPALGLAVAALTAGASLTLAFDVQRGRAARTP